MRYSVIPLSNDSQTWTILDDHDAVVFSGPWQQREDWLDLVDSRAASHAETPAPLAPRLPVFEQAAALLRDLWEDCAGELHVSGELPAILLMLLVIAGMATHFVWPALSEPSRLFRSVSAVAREHELAGMCGASPGATTCCVVHPTDMACDNADEAN